MMDTTNLSNVYNKQGGTFGGPSRGANSSSSGGGDYTSKPSWAPDSWYRNWYTGSPDYTNEPMNQYAANQGWWRGPDAAGGLLYNNLYGWQDANSVRDKYMSYGAPVSNEQFTQNWFTPQTDQNWAQYYPDRNTDAGWQAAGYTWDGQNWVPGGGNSGVFTIGGGQFGDGRMVYGQGGAITPPGPGEPPPGGSSDGGGNMADYGPFNNYPQDWYQARNTLTGLAQTGGRTPDPTQWYDATDVANQMAYNGMPTDVSPWYKAAKSQTQYDIADAIKQANEQAGLAGNRWSSVAQRNAQDIGARAMTRLGVDYAQQALAAQEAARGRQQGAINQLQSLGAGSAGLSENAVSRAQSSAEALGSIGNLFAQYPLQVANQGYNMGQGIQATDQAALDRKYQDAQRLMAENNPFLRYLQSMVTQQGTPTQYKSGCFG